jgi:acyl-CoA oxidase
MELRKTLLNISISLVDDDRQRTMAKIGSLVHCVTNEPLDIFQKRMEVIGLFDPGFWTRFGVHYGLFVGAIVSGKHTSIFYTMF